MSRGNVNLPVSNNLKGVIENTIVFTSLMLVSFITTGLLASIVLSYADDNVSQELSVEINPVASLTLSSNNLAFDIVPTIDGTFESKSITATAHTNSTGGYELYFSSEDNNTDMNHQDSNVLDKITSNFDGTVTSTTMSPNTWAYSLDNTNFLKIPTLDNQLKLKDIDHYPTNQEKTNTLYIGTKISNSLKSGAYEKTIKFTEVAHNSAPPTTVFNFDYTGGEQTWTAPATGYYKLETWGASGGTAYVPSRSTSYRGGYGGYSVGIAKLTANTNYYVVVGGGGNEVTANCVVTVIGNGYNGGGNPVCETADANGLLWSSGSGGATHISTNSGLLSNLSSHATDGSILIVSGGGGGAAGAGGNYATTHVANGGNGGGIVGMHGDAAVNSGYAGSYYTGAGGGTQTAGGSSNNTVGYTWAISSGFGRGCSSDTTTSITNHTYNKTGGGGGYYGGGCCSHSGGGGGSGYIGSSNLISGGGITKHMTCYSCTTSTDASTRTNSNTNYSTSPIADYSKQGNGYARITYIGTRI